MQDLIGKTFKYGKTEYKITSVQEFDKSLTNLIEKLESNDKHPAIFFASKVLASGKPSKQGGAFYGFKSKFAFVKI